MNAVIAGKPAIVEHADRGPIIVCRTEPLLATDSIDVPHLIR